MRAFSFPRPAFVPSCTARGTYSGGALVLTAGAGMAELVAELQPHLRVERQLVAHFAPAGEELRSIPIFCLEEPDGAFYYGFPDLGNGCKIARHHGDAD